MNDAAIHVPSQLMKISDIIQQNVAWAREDLGDLSGLRRSIRNHGILLPILMTVTYQVADGARRIMAAKAEGLHEVPVHITGDWDSVIRYHQRKAQLEADGWLSQKLDLRTIWVLKSNQYKELYENKRRTDKVNNRRNLRSRAETRYNYGENLGPVLGIYSQDLRTIQDIFSSLKAVQAEHPELEAQCLALIEEVDDGGDLGLHSLLRVVRAAAKGVAPSTIRTVRGHRTLWQPPRPKGRTSERPTSTLAEQISAETLTAVTDKVAALADRIEWVRTLDPKLGKDEVADAAKSIRESVRLFVRFARLLENNDK